MMLVNLSSESESFIYECENLYYFKGRTRITNTGKQSTQESMWTLNEVKYRILGKIKIDDRLVSFEEGRWMEVVHDCVQSPTLALAT